MADEIPPAPPEAPAEAPPDIEGGTKILAQVAQQFAEIGEYLSCYLNTQLDRAKLSVRELILKLFLGVVGLSLVLGALVISLVFVFYGTALGLGKVMGDQVWLGFLVTGALVLTVSALSLKIYQGKIKKRILRREVLKYEARLEEQRAKFGHSALERAEEFSPAGQSSPE